MLTRCAEGATSPGRVARASVPAQGAGVAPTSASPSVRMRSRHSYRGLLSHPAVFPVPPEGRGTLASVPGSPVTSRLHLCLDEVSFAARRERGVSQGPPGGAVPGPLARLLRSEPPTLIRSSVTCSPPPLEVVFRESAAHSPGTVDVKVYGSETRWET